jgi:hypothetical protein
MQKVAERYALQMQKSESKLQEEHEVLKDGTF